MYFRKVNYNPTRDKMWLPYTDVVTEGEFLSIYNSSKQLQIPWGRNDFTFKKNRLITDALKKFLFVFKWGVCACQPSPNLSFTFAL